MGVGSKEVKSYSPIPSLVHTDDRIVEARPLQRIDKRFERIEERIDTLEERMSALMADRIACLGTKVSSTGSVKRCSSGPPARLIAYRVKTAPRT